MKSGGFRTDFTPEIRRISEDQLPRMVSPMFQELGRHDCSQTLVFEIRPVRETA